MSVPANEVRAAEALVDRWWVDGLPVVDWWTRRVRDLDPTVEVPDRMPGRPRALRMRTLLVGWTLVGGTVTGDDKMLINRVHTKLMNLHPATQRRLGVRWDEPDGTTRLITERQVYYLWGQMVAAVDGSPNFNGKDLDDERRAARDRDLQALVDRLLAATMPDDLDHAGSYSVDSTYLPSWAKPYWRADRRTRSNRGRSNPSSTSGDAGDGDAEVELVETDDGRLVNPETGEIVDSATADLTRDTPDDNNADETDEDSDQLGDDELDTATDEELAEALAALAADADPTDADQTNADADQTDEDADEPEDADADGDAGDDSELFDGPDKLADGLRQAEEREQVRRGHRAGDGTFRSLTPAQRAALTHDPDARHRFMARRSKKTGNLNVKTDVFGYQITIGVRVREDDGPAVPALCERLVVKPANNGEAEASIELLTRLNEEGQKLSDIVADRGFTFRRPENFHLPIRRMGGQLVMDLHTLQRGVRGTYGGSLLIDGELFSPGLPQNLYNLDQPQPADSRRQVEAKLDQFEWRQAWALRRVAGGLRERRGCPAAGRDARIICDLKPTSATLDPATRQQVYPDPNWATQLPICQQASITVPLELDAWRRQKHPFGTLAWWESFKPRRNAVEGFFGNLKTPGTEHLHRGTTRSFGLAANTLLVAFLAAATNIRLLQTFKRDHNAKSTDLFTVGDHDTAPQYRTARKTRDAVNIRALQQRGAAIRRGPRPALRKPLPLALVGAGTGGPPGNASP